MAALLKLVSLFIAIQFVALVAGQSANSLAKNPKSKPAGKDRYFSKSYGEVQFNKYRGQLPQKGAMIECALDCLTLATCHCIGLNIHTSECHFYGIEESPSYYAWKAANGNGSSGMSHLSTNATNRDYIFFTRDIFADESFDKVDIVAGRKVLTSWILEKGASAAVDPKKSKAKPKDQKKVAKEKPKAKNSKKSATDKSFPLPWIQYEFKEPMYITEILLITSKDRSNELKKFQVRIGNESIAKFYETELETGEEESIQGWANAKPFDKNNVCFEQETSLTSAGFFATGIKKANLVQKTIKCQPCGLMGRFISIQSLEPCANCKEPESVSEKPGRSTKTPTTTTLAPAVTLIQQYPIPIGSIQIFGYPVGGKGRD